MLKHGTLAHDLYAKWHQAKAYASHATDAEGLRQAGHAFVDYMVLLATSGPGELAAALREVRSFTGDTGEAFGHQKAALERVATNLHIKEARNG